MYLELKMKNIPVETMIPEKELNAENMGYIIDKVLSYVYEGRYALDKKTQQKLKVFNSIIFIVYFF